MSNSGKVTLSINSNVDMCEEAKYYADEFLLYKEYSLEDNIDNFATKNEQHQKRETPVHATFGRDRVFDYPRKYFVDIDFENLAHVHVDIDGVWDVNNTSQWNCTSQYSIVYSGFKVSDLHFHFIIHDLHLNFDNYVEFDAHDNYEKEDIEYYLECSSFFRNEFLRDNK